MKPDKQAYSVKNTIGDDRRQIPVFLFKVTPNGESKKTKSSVQYLSIQSLFLCIPCWLLVNKNTADRISSDNLKLKYFSSQDN